jgi:nucleoside-diphosphate-sugar epimerase
MKRALVCGAGGFIGGHLVKKLKREGYWVRGVDIKYHEFSSYKYGTSADDMVEGIFLLMQSNLHGAANIGCPQYVTVNELVDTVACVAGKTINVKHIDGPVGVQSRNFSNARIYSIGWKPKIYLKEGIQLTYPWIKEQVDEMHRHNHY